MQQYFYNLVTTIWLTRYADVDSVLTNNLFRLLSKATSNQFCSAFQPPNFRCVAFVQQHINYESLYVIISIHHRRRRCRQHHHSTKEKETTTTVSKSRIGPMYLLWFSTSSPLWGFEPHSGSSHRSPRIPLSLRLTLGTFHGSFLYHTLFLPVQLNLFFVSYSQLSTIFTDLFISRSGVNLL